MTIEFVGSNTAASPDFNQSTITVTFPGGVSQNDYAIVAGDSKWTADLNITCTGYNELADLYSDDNNDCNFAVFRKIQGATPDSSVTIDFTQAQANSAVLQVFSGVDTSTPEDATTTTAEVIDDGTTDCPSIDTSTANAWVIAAGASTEPDVVTNPPTGYSNLDWVGFNTANTMMSSRLVSSPTTEDPPAYSDIVGNASDSYCAATVAIRPAAGGAVAAFVMFPTRLDGIGRGGIFPGNRVQ